MNYDFDEKINRRGTGSVKWDTYGNEYIPMFIADMDFKPSPQIVAALKDRTAHEVYGYTRPDRLLYETIANWFYQTYHYVLEESWIRLLPGIVPALAVAAHIAPGKAAANTPNYPMLLQGPVRAGKELILSPLKETNDYYEMDFADLEQRLTSDTDIFYLCNPHNPVGRVYQKDELAGLSRFAQDNDLLVIADEIHCELVFDRPHIPFLTVDEYAKQHSITLMSPSKTYNIPGLGMAFAIIPNPDLRKKFAQISYALPHPGFFGLEACKAAYGNSGQWRDELVAYLQSNRDYLEEELTQRFPKAKFTHVEGTYLQWIDFRPYGIKDPHGRLLHEAKIALSDGRDFGLDGYVRLNFGCRRELLAEALQRIGSVIQ
ncbi:Cystathionine beta-lyase [Syntrophobotulus glycolicus DSM 8271]|uniref:cysteine-S-conjugate beta-lyase n=1 Tax=Syntrophobotulus glycolicus (strain DSM 8271 / FlGlyR) TaxID=645991 RepID=F0T2I0_SYNGF|nr:PatB family C-S lyase [Syntrophobotulus glycolicus]ADY55298.1 Cystathionine beta-lyase [Syntrophobotulus glycolicus DSM 8271]